MERSVHRVLGPYRVTFSPEAWRLIGIMSSAAFESLQLALERIAHSPARATAQAQSPLSATLDGLTVIYEVNDTDRTLTVVNIVQARSGEAP